MKILIFTEGTILMHSTGKNVKRTERIRQVESQIEDIHNYADYIPIGNAVEKITKWTENGYTIYYLTSRRTTLEVDQIQNVLTKNNFPKGELLYRSTSEEYKDVAERLLPYILIEGDCESIGGIPEMTYPNMSDTAKGIVKSISVKEFGGIGSLPDKS